MFIFFIEEIYYCILLLYFDFMKDLLQIGYCNINTEFNSGDGVGDDKYSFF